MVLNITFCNNTTKHRIELNFFFLFHVWNYLRIKVCIGLFIEFKFSFFFNLTKTAENIVYTLVLFSLNVRSKSVKIYILLVDGLRRYDRYDCSE